MAGPHRALAETRNAVESAFRDAGIDAGSRVLLAVSGGSDSMALAQAALFVASRAGGLSRFSRLDGFRIRCDDLGDLAQRQAAVGEPADAQEPGQVLHPVLAPAAYRGRDAEQAQAVVVAHRSRGGAGQVGDLGDAHSVISAGDAASPSRVLSRPPLGRL